MVRRFRPEVAPSQPDQRSVGHRGHTTLLRTVRAVRMATVMTDPTTPGNDLLSHVWDCTTLAGLDTLPGDQQEFFRFDGPEQQPVG